ncbi:MAG: hypothetical protein ACXWZS_04510 [Gemmatirosa sp.]
MRRAPALLDARELWVPRYARRGEARRVAESTIAEPGAENAGHDDAWALRGASLAVWAGEVVCVVGGDLTALDALLGCLAGATPAGGAVRARGAWWRTGLLLRARALESSPVASLAWRLHDAAARRPPDGAVVCALALPDHPRAWYALAEAVAREADHAPLRCVRLAAGRVVPPPRSVDPPDGRS